jgi:hypothetical protein
VSSTTHRRAEARSSLVALAAAVLAILSAAPLLAYNVKLKDGSIIFARAKYDVKGKKAIITLQNGTVVSYDLDQIDIPGTDQYNKDNPGNVLVIDTADSKTVIVPTQPAAATLQDVIKKKKVTFEAPSKRSNEVNQATASMQVDAAVEAAFRKVLDGAGIQQYRLTNQKGKVRFLATANTEEAVFNTLSAVARALADLGGRGQDVSVDIVLTTSSGDSGGNFEMNAEQARLIVNGNTPVADYFLKHVIL